MSWIVVYELHRKLPLTADERVTLTRHLDRWKGGGWELTAYNLAFPEGASGIVASGRMELSRIPDDCDAARFMMTLAELRQALPHARCRVKSLDGFKMTWVTKSRLYTYSPFSMRTPPG